MKSVDRDSQRDAILNDSRVFDAIDRFERDLFAGNEPQLEEYVPGDFPNRLVLLEELVHIELEYRGERQQAVMLSEYLGRFPELAANESCVERLRSSLRKFAADGRPLSGEAADHASPCDSFDDVRAICARYVVDHQQQNGRPIKEYVARITAGYRPVLLRNLLHLELERLRGAGEDPEVEEYLRQLPDHASLIRQVLLESATISMARSDTSDRTNQQNAQNAEAINPLAGAGYIGSYRLVRELGRGGMGTVYEAVHLGSGERVALKTLPAVGASSLHRFKREFRSVAEINHPNLIGLHSLESDGDHWFFTMDLIQGTDFRSYVRPNETLHLERLRDSVTQLVAAVLALHGRKIIHRDLKPSNVLVTNEGRVLVLDFGLVVEQYGIDNSYTGQVAGTPAYMAPEQALAQSVSGAADWYSVGVMLYEALTGKWPYPSCSALELMRRKTSEDPAPITVESGAPDDLAILAMALLARDPQQRPDPFEVVKRLSGHRVPSASVASNTGSILVGRRHQLGELRAAFKTVRESGRSVAVFVSGKSGEGKTSLIDHFLQSLSAADGEPVVLLGRCYDRESVPFKALDSLIDALTSYLRKLPDTAAALLMPDDVGFLAALFPVLQRVAVVEQLKRKNVSELDQQQVRKRAFSALRSLLYRTTQRTPVILIADDLQWGDTDSAEALFEVLRQPDSPAVLFIGSYRSDELNASPFLAKWKSLNSSQEWVAERAVAVSPLSLDDCIELTINLVGVDTETVRRRAFECYQETRGNAFLFTELVGCFDPTTDSFRAIPIHEVIDTKLARLPAEAVSLLNAIAVSGQAISVHEVAQAVECASAALAVVTHMRSEKLVRLIGSQDDTRVDTYHDRIREASLDRMGANLRRSLHRSLARVIEASCTPLSDAQIAAIENGGDEDDLLDVPRVFDLAYHFDEAGESRRACVYAMLGARQASRQFSQQSAAEQFAVAKRNVSPDQGKMRCRIARGEARALCLLGNYDAAAVTLEGQAELASDPYEQACVYGLQAEIEHKQGKIGRGIGLYSQALGRLGCRVPTTVFGLAFGLAREVVIQCLHSILPKWCYQKDQLPSRSEALAIELANRNCIVCYYNNSVRMLWTHLKGLNLAETRRPAPGLPYTYGLHPAPLATVGMRSRGLRFSNIALAMATEAGDLLTQGHCYAMRAMADYASGDYQAAVISTEKAIALLAEAGDPYIRFIAEVHASYCYTRLTETKKAIERAYQGFDRSVRSGEGASAAGLLSGLALATNGDFPFRELRTCFSVSEDDHFSRALVGLSEGIWHAKHERWERAATVFEEAWSQSWRHCVIVPYSVLLLVWLTMVRRQHAESLPANSDLRRSLLGQAWRTAKFAKWLTCFYSSERAFALREYGLLLCLRGRTRAGLRQLKRSVALSEKQNDKWQHALSSLALGRIEVGLGLAGGAERVALAQSTLSRVASEIAGSEVRCLMVAQGSSRVVQQQPHLAEETA